MEGALQKKTGITKSIDNLSKAPSNLEKIAAYFSFLLCHVKGLPENPNSIRLLSLIKLEKLLYLVETFISR